MNNLQARQTIANFLETTMTSTNKEKKEKPMPAEENTLSEDIYNFEDTDSNKELSQSSLSPQQNSFEKWNPVKNQKTLRFTGQEIIDLRESAQVGRWGIDQEHVESLALLIAKDGRQLVPVGVRKGADGKPELVFGRHRKHAIIFINSNLEMFGLTEPFPLLYVYVNLSEEQAIKACISENRGKPLTIVDLAHMATSLESLGWDNGRIAEAMSTPWNKVSPVRVSQLKRYITLPHPTLVKLDKGLIPESAAKALFKVAVDRANMIELSEKLERGEIKAGDLIREANAKSRERGKKVRRSIIDLKEKLIDIGTGPALDLLGWLDGEHNDEDRLNEIFAEGSPLIDLEKEMREMEMEEGEEDL